MQDTNLSLDKGFKVKIFDTWKFIRVDSKIDYPCYEISYSKKAVYLDKDVNEDRIKKIVYSAAKDICMTNYGGGRENPFIQWLCENTEVEIDLN